MREETAPAMKWRTPFEAYADGVGNIGKERRRIDVLPVSDPVPAPERPEPSREPAPAR